MERVAVKTMHFTIVLLSNIFLFIHHLYSVILTNKYALKRYA